MLYLNLLSRPVLIVPEEVIKNTPTGTSSDATSPQRVLHAIQIAEESFIRPVLGYQFYEDLVNSKNVEVTTGNRAAKQTLFDDQYGVNAIILEVGDVINSDENLSADNLKLWNYHLCKLVAECVRYTVMPEAYADLTNSGMMKNNPATPFPGAGDSAKSVGVDIKEAKWLMDQWFMKRISPLIEALKVFLCANAAKYSTWDNSICPGCDGSNKISNLGKTGWLDIYDNEDPKCCNWMAE